MPLEVVTSGVVAATVPSFKVLTSLLRPEKPVLLRMEGGPDAMAESTAAMRYVGPALYKALSNPLRHQIIMRTGERPWSPKEISDDLGVPLKRVCEQIDVLLGLDPPLLELVEERPGPRGSTVHLYRALIRARLNHEDWANLSPAEQAAQTVTITEELHKEWIASINAGLFHADPDHVLLRTPLNLDREGMRRLNKMLEAVQDDFADVERESAERMAVSGEQAKRVITGLASFPAATDRSGQIRS